MPIAADPDRILRLLSDLIALESVNPSLEGGQRGEADVARYVTHAGAALGLDVEQQEVFTDRPNVLLHIHRTDSAPTLLFEAHMDTVPIGYMPDALQPRLQGGQIYGRGACDTKGSLAAMLYALEVLVQRRHDLNSNVILAATVDEEYTYRGVLSLIERGLHADGAMVGEPTDVRPVLAHKGCLRFQIITAGRAAHTSNPEEGANAISAMARVIQYIEEHVTPDLAWRQHPLCGQPSLTFTMIEGGVAINIVPPSCIAAVDRRYIPGERTDDIYDRIDQVLTEIRSVDPSVEIRRGKTLLEDWALDTPPDAAVARAAAAACASIGVPNTFIGVPYGSDASKLATLGGIQSIVLGPGSIRNAHTSNEHVSVADLVSAAQVYVGTALHFADAFRETI